MFYSDGGSGGGGGLTCLSASVFTFMKVFSDASSGSFAKAPRIWFTSSTVRDRLIMMDSFSIHVYYIVTAYRVGDVFWFVPIRTLFYNDLVEQKEQDQSVV